MDQTIDLIIKNEEKISAADRLIEAAGPMFSEQPFDAVSTREIARAAKVNLSAISYHFGNKEGLYEAVFDKLIKDLEPFRAGFSNFLDAGIVAAKDNPEMQREVLRTFIFSFIETITSDENPRWWMRLMLREGIGPGPCFEKVMAGHIDVMHNLVGRLVSVITQKPERSVYVELTSHSILGCCLQYALNEPLISHRVGWDGFGEAEIEIIKNETVEMISSILGLTSPDNKKGA